MTNETPTKQTEPKVFEHPALPQAHNKALNFWAVFLEGCAGPTPALPTWKDQPYILDRGEWEGTVPLFATNGVEFARMENKKPRVERDGRGKPKTRSVRVWQDAISKTKKYFEDPDVAATGSKPRVRGAMLFCPNLGPAGLGQEPHGVYQGLGETTALNMPGKPGYCPKCNHDPLEEARAIQFAYDAWKKSGLKIPSDLENALAKAKLEGRVD
jgi:hypothetical protein